MQIDASAPPLAGLRVLDFTRHMSGPYATVALADYGADVIKIESTPQGDPARVTGDMVDGKISSTYLIWNRGKRSVALDMRDPDCMAAVLKLVETADVVIENYRPGVADKIGIGYEALSALNPRLIYLSLSAFGRGPLEPYPGTDPVVQAMSGIMSVTGERGGAPLLVGVPVADFTAAMVAVQGITLALLARHRTGRGQRVDISMLHALISSLTTRLASFWATGVEPPRYGGAHSVVMPYQVWETADGHVVAGVWFGANEMWPTFCEALGCPDLGKDLAYVTNNQRLAARDELAAKLQQEFIRQPTAYWEKRFRERNVLFSPVHTFGEILSHEHVRQAGVVARLHHPDLGELDQITPVVQMSETPGRLVRHAPRLGEHTREVLREAGLADAEIDRLLARKTAIAFEQPAPALA